MLSEAVAELLGSVGGRPFLRGHGGPALAGIDVRVPVAAHRGWGGAATRSLGVVVDLRCGFSLGVALFCRDLVNRAVRGWPPGVAPRGRRSGVRRRPVLRGHGRGRLGQGTPRSPGPSDTPLYAQVAHLRARLASIRACRAAARLWASWSGTRRRHGPACGRRLGRGAWALSGHGGGIRR